MPGLVALSVVFLIWMARKRWLRKLPRAPVQFAGRGWSWDQLSQGVIIFGGIGSGKSYSSEPLIEQLIAAGCPMLITSVKPDEYRRYVRICKKLGCLHRLVLINDKNRNYEGKLYSINFLDEILKTSSPADAASFIMDMGQAGGGSHGGDNAAFWRNQEHASYRYATRLAQLAYGHASVKAVYDIIRTTPNDRAHAESGTYDTDPNGVVRKDEKGKDIVLRFFDFDKLHPQAGAFAQAMHRVLQLHGDKSPVMGDFNRIQTFFMSELCATDKIRGSVIAGVMGTLGRLVDQPWKDLLSESVLTPEIIQRDRLVAVIDMPVMRFHEPARLFNSLWVMMTQRYLMQRDASEFEEVFVIQRDEAGFVLSSSWDSKAHNVLRQQKCCSIAIVQCLDTLKAALGGTQQTEQEAMAFASQHMHKLAFANYSHSTNEWFSQIGGQYKGIMPSAGGQPIEGDILAEAMGCRTTGWSMQFLPVVRSEAFTQLSTGCAYLFTGGRVDYVNLRREH